LSYLRREAPYNEANRPDIILLDINLPGKNGIETLAEIRADTELTNIPIVILTTSTAEEDIVKSYELHVNCYILKPSNLDDFTDLVKMIELFWFRAVQLPSRVAA
jgi:chemotaxis family two-component system response regulator Rcp1